MSEATIHLAEDGFGQSAAGVVYGKLTLNVDGLHFPDPRWSDFVVVVLRWWCAALVRLLRTESGPIEVRFMEGPYLAELGPLQGRSLRLVLIEAGLKRCVLCQSDVEVGPLVKSVLSAAERTLAECRKRDWWSKDADELAEMRQQLQQEVSPTLN